jgi:hypothetical protein
VGLEAGGPALDAGNLVKGVGYTALAAPLRRVDFARGGAYATEHCFQPSAYGVPNDAVAVVLHVYLEKGDNLNPSIINVLPRSARGEVGKSTQLYLNVDAASVSNTVTVATTGDAVCVFVNTDFAYRPVRGFADVIGYYAPNSGGLLTVLRPARQLVAATPNRLYAILSPDPAATAIVAAITTRAQAGAPNFFLQPTSCAGDTTSLGDPSMLDIPSVRDHTTEVLLRVEAGKACLRMRATTADGNASNFPELTVDTLGAFSAAGQLEYVAAAPRRVAEYRGLASLKLSAGPVALVFNGAPIPGEALALVAQVTVDAPPQNGFLKLAALGAGPVDFGGDTGNLNYHMSRIAMNQATFGRGPGGVALSGTLGATVGIIVDMSGYYRQVP